MARPSKLSDKQWDELQRRVLAGEKPADLAREYGVSKTAISVRVSKRVEGVKAVANQIVDAEQALQRLPISEQLQAVSLAAKLRAISDNLASAAMHGAATAHRLTALANTEVAKVDDADPLSAKSLEAMKGVAALTRLANESSTIALNLVAANKERVKSLDEPEAPPPSLNDFYGGLTAVTQSSAA